MTQDFEPDPLIDGDRNGRADSQHRQRVNPHTQQCGKEWAVSTPDARTDVLCREGSSVPRLPEGEVRSDTRGTIAVCLGGDRYLRWKVIGEDSDCIVTHGWRSDGQVQSWTVQGNVHELAAMPV